MTFETLTRLSDAELLAGMGELVATKGRNDALFVAHLAETEQRRLHLEAGFSSLFDYCLRGLGLSENEAFHRITAARLARRFPQLLELLHARAVTLSAACFLRDHLTEENHVELLGAASHKSKRELEAYLAARFPAEPRRSSVRRLPQRVTARIAKPLQMGGAAMHEPTPRMSAGPLGGPTELASSSPSTFEIERASVTSVREEHHATDNFEAERADMAASAGFERRAVHSGTTQKAVAAALFRVQFDATAELKAKLETANALFSHANPKGDFAVTIERALDVLIERLEKERWAKTSRPRNPRAQSGATTGQKAAVATESLEIGASPMPELLEIQAPVVQAPVVQAPETQLPETRAVGDSRKRKRIANGVRRVVVGRDDACCSFVSETGQRCGARAFLQLHHEQPWARGGSDGAENLRLLCAAHNQLMAERDFGREHMARARSH